MPKGNLLPNASLQALQSGTCCWQVDAFELAVETPSPQQCFWPPDSPRSIYSPLSAAHNSPAQPPLQSPQLAAAPLVTAADGRSETVSAEPTPEKQVARTARWVERLRAASESDSEDDVRRETSVGASPLPHAPNTNLACVFIRQHTARWALSYMCKETAAALVFKACIRLLWWTAAAASSVFSEEDAYTAAAPGPSPKPRHAMALGMSRRSSSIYVPHLAEPSHPLHSQPQVSGTSSGTDPAQAPPLPQPSHTPDRLSLGVPRR